MEALAVVLEAPQRLRVRPLDLVEMGPEEALVEVEWSGVSTGTERLLWSGRMPRFPGMGYPLVPGYESVGRVVQVGEDSRVAIGQRVFAPGSSGFKKARGLFGGAAKRLIASSRRLTPIPEEWREQGVLLALAATARHALQGGPPPELIVGHGVLGRLLARVAIASGAPAPSVWEIDPARRAGAMGYPVYAPEADERRDYRAIYDASGQADLLDPLIARLGKGGEIVLAGFYEAPLSFQFPAAFQREARLRIAAEFTPADVAAVSALIAAGALSLEGLITHRRAAPEAEDAYRTAFEDSACLKMILDWRDCA
jgi:3-hydroxyethyl bacteriochlorophyllide a dehydrogenase